MTKKIPKERLTEIMNQLQEETKKEFADALHEFYSESKKMPLDDFINDMLPKMLTRIWFESTNHAELLVFDVLKELDLLSDVE